MVATKATHKSILGIDLVYDLAPAPFNYMPKT